MDIFLIARNPEEDSKLPYLLRLPIGEGWSPKPRHLAPLGQDALPRLRQGWPDDVEVNRRNPGRIVQAARTVIDLVLDRPRLARSQFVFTETRGRPAIFS